MRSRNVRIFLEGKTVPKSFLILGYAEWLKPPMIYRLVQVKILAFYILLCAKTFCLHAGCLKRRVFGKLPMEVQPYRSRPEGPLIPKLSSGERCLYLVVAEQDWH
ncbi:hypothetical protein WH96_11255 [Kiloniella spongiae]|uniref:Uncharacterized protein n=1 Tax=Kiloniella spongiae TaxID=1489064 RepID=A0A0H2MER1_9PROT|nr:hypothetical protein WH96_11255 [Kiloniella spongiae]